MNKIQSVITLVKNPENPETTDFITIKQKSSTYIEYKGYNIGSMFHGGGRKNHFSLSFAPGTELENYLGQRFEIEKSDTEQHRVVWFDLNNSDDFFNLIDVLNNLPKFESSLRMKNQRH